jgi:hypothetical protein
MTRRLQKQFASMMFIDRADTRGKTSASAVERT